MKVAVVMNEGAGSVGKAECHNKADRVKEALTRAGLFAEVHICPGDKLGPTARELAKSSVDIVVAAGGDGTVNAVASALVGGSKPLAVLPLGTLNHFARDIGMPNDLDEAAQAIATGRTLHIDVGEVNGHYFVNNSSIGLYSELVVSREKQQRQLGRGKWWAMMIAAMRVLRRFPLMRVQITTEKDSLVSVTPLVFIGNNEFQTNALDLGTRARLDAGCLGLYLFRSRSRMHMIWLMIRSMLQHHEKVDEFERRVVSSAAITPKQKNIKVALDGEVVTMTTPLLYRTHAGALAVRLPKEKA